MKIDIGANLVARIDADKCYYDVPPRAPRSDRSADLRAGCQPGGHLMVPMRTSDYVVLTLLGVGYFLPALIGFWRNIDVQGRLLMLNITLGWTFIGWVICMTLAVYCQSLSDVDPVVAYSGRRERREPHL